MDGTSGRFLYQNGRVGDEAKKRKSPVVGITENLGYETSFLYNLHIFSSWVINLLSNVFEVSMYNIVLTSHVVCILTHPMRSSKYSTTHKIYYRPKLIYVPSLYTLLTVISWMSCLMTGMEAEDSRQSHSAVSLSQQGAAKALVLSPCLQNNLDVNEM